MNDDLFFIEWMQEVNFLLRKKIGVGSEDLPDASYYTYFDSKLKPEEAVREVLEELEYDV